MDWGTFAAREPPTAFGRPFLSLPVEPPTAFGGCDVMVGSREVKCERTAALPLRRKVRGVLTVGRGETTIGEKVDPRRAQVAQVGEREENCVFTQ